MNCKVKQGCLTSESCCILLWLAFTLFPVSVVTAADNRKSDESQQKEGKGEMKALPNALNISEKIKYYTLVIRTLS